MDETGRVCPGHPRRMRAPGRRFRRRPCTCGVPPCRGGAATRRPRIPAVGRRARPRRTVLRKYPIPLGVAV